MDTRQFTGQASIPSTSKLLGTLLDKGLETRSFSFKSLVNPIHVAVANSNMVGLRVLLQHAEVQNWVQKAIPKENPGSEPNDEAREITQATSSLLITPSGKKASLCDFQIDVSRLEWAWNRGSLTTNLLPWGAAAMHVAAKIGSIDCVSILLEYGAAIDCILNYNQTPAHIAAIEGHSRLLNLLQKNGANLNLQYYGESTAMSAIIGGLVLNFGWWGRRDWSDCNEFSSSILHCAALNNPQTLSLLLGLGCDPYSVDGKGFTAIEVAIENSNTCPALLPVRLN